MNETDAVSCLLCLQADEYGSMIKVCVPPGRIPPSPERVICRRCAVAISDAMRESQGDEIGNLRSDEATVRRDGPSEPSRGAVDNPDWDSGLPERAAESLVEIDRSEPEDATGSSGGAPKGSLSGPGADENANYVGGEPVNR
jgi:hypothetical protein